MADLLILNGILITMDPDRRVIENGAIAVQGDRIIGPGSTKDVLATHHAPKIIDASRMVVMPSLIVDGDILMEKRIVKTGNKKEVLEMGLREAEAMLDRTHFWNLVKVLETFRGHTRY